MIPPILVHQLVFSWWATARRHLPWRETLPGLSTRDPYRVLVSELMLQQTQVSRVIPKYEAFLTTWPTLVALSEAKLSEVIIAWQGLGYNRRAKHLLETAVIVRSSHDGIFPTEESVIRTLPGLGPYTTRAVLVFAFGKQCAVVDTNVSRILQRVLIGLEQASPSEIAELAEHVVPKDQADPWGQALMDLGAMVCLARKPLCGVCPLSRICRAKREAARDGYDDVGSWLAARSTPKQQKGKDQGKRFEETDRYFRGRIIDALRAQGQPMQRLWEMLRDGYGLDDRKRFGSLIESLVVDRLIAVTGNDVRLAD